MASDSLKGCALLLVPILIVAAFFWFTPEDPAEQCSSFLKLALDAEQRAEDHIHEGYFRDAQSQQRGDMARACAGVEIALHWTLVAQPACEKSPQWDRPGVREQFEHVLAQRRGQVSLCEREGFAGK